MEFSRDGDALSLRAEIGTQVGSSGDFDDIAIDGNSNSLIDVGVITRHVENCCRLRITPAAVHQGRPLWKCRYSLDEMHRCGRHEHCEWSGTHKAGSATALANTRTERPPLSLLQVK